MSSVQSANLCPSNRSVMLAFACTHTSFFFVLCVLKQCLEITCTDYIIQFKQIFVDVYQCFPVPCLAACDSESICWYSESICERANLFLCYLPMRSKRLGLGCIGTGKIAVISQLSGFSLVNSTNLGLCTCILITY